MRKTTVASPLILHNKTRTVPRECDAKQPPQLKLSLQLGSRLAVDRTLAAAAIGARHVSAARERTQIAPLPSAYAAFLIGLLSPYGQLER